MNLRDRFGVAPTHTLAELERLRALCPGEVALWTTVDGDGRVLAGSVVFRVSDSGAHAFYFAQDYARHELRPMPGLG